MIQIPNKAFEMGLTPTEFYIFSQLNYLPPEKRSIYLSGEPRRIRVGGGAYKLALEALAAKGMITYQLDEYTNKYHITLTQPDYWGKGAA